ncbi:hypothetical protein QFZ77_002571 [Paenibacillus sp. V4I3]|uniref:hypothetical protein n=1 Tax=unclassified Paenibacillus TaxID=185978 RepID=UPI00277E3467|nr:MULTISPECIES: hypothetical protein [unclassified Paenibacillus]MDQ0873912.1 hypothetical protein [Paenibacillus sp. V4I3]MDQ0890211.1 hypothetical protein [Paenibacillus sp. V4I9]
MRMSRRKSEFIVLSILMLLFINLFAEPPIALAERTKSGSLRSVKAKRIPSRATKIC